MNAGGRVSTQEHPSDRSLLERLRDMWTHRDPVPPDLAERSLVAVGIDDLDLELMLLSDQLPAASGVRGVETARTLTFSGEAVSVMITITRTRRNHFRLDGWVAPLGGGQVEVRHTSGRPVLGEVDRDGRFVVRDVPAGTAQLVYHPRETLQPDALDPRTGTTAPRSHPIRSVAAPPVHL